MRRSEAVFDDEGMPLVVNPMKQARRELDLSVLARIGAGVRSVGRLPEPDLRQRPGAEPRQRPGALPRRQRAPGGTWCRSSAPGSTCGRTCTSTTSSRSTCSRSPRRRRARSTSPKTARRRSPRSARRIAQRLGLARRRGAADPQEAAARWGESKACFTLGSNSRVRARRARRELGWAPRHASVLDWIAGEMPIDAGEPTT